MGSHTDYNEGRVLTMTVDRDTWLAVRPHGGTAEWRVASLDLPGEAEFALGGLAPGTSRCPGPNYVRGGRGGPHGQSRLRTSVGFDGRGALGAVPFGALGLAPSAAHRATAALLAFATVSGFQVGPLQTGSPRPARGETSSWA